MTSDKNSGFFSTHLPILQVDFVAKHDEGKVLRVARAGLDQKLIPPAVQRLEGVGCRDIEDEHTAVSSAIECHAQRLKTLLTRCVPNLFENYINNKSIWTNHL